eukprot:3012970-Pyramimonas_sp.AAC.1
MAFQRGSESSKRSSQVDPWRWSPESIVVAVFRVLNGCLPTKQRNSSPSGNELLYGAYEEGAWRDLFPESLMTLGFTLVLLLLILILILLILLLLIAAAHALVWR